jgi:translation initiation factor IF-2
VAEKGSFISRFFYKLLEITGAAVATAVSGYLVAHLGGFLPSQTHPPTPPAVAVAPSERPVPKSVPANAQASQPATPPQATQSAASPASPDADHRPGQPQQEATGSAAQTVRKTAKASAAQPQPRKPGRSETAATEANRPRETTEAKPREAAEAKPREAEAKPREAEDKESVEARVRAALANVDANPRRGDNPGPAAQPRPGETSPNTTAAVPPRPLDLPPASVGPGVQPRSADLGSPAQQPTVQPAAIQSPAAQTAPAQPAPLQVAPVQPTPPDALTTVEIKSRPVATIDTAPAPEAAPPPQEERGVLSVFKRILPDLRRPAPSDEAPRPPAPVGE